MALITCPECGKDISDQAQACPACGFPLATRSDAAAPPIIPAVEARPVETLDPQTVLLEVRPSWWTFTWHLLFCWLVIPLIIALYRRHSFVMRIYPDRVVVEEGFWSKESTEFFIKDIRSIEVRQGMWGRMVGIGDITISTAATVDAAEVASGVPEPNRVRELLISRRQQFTT